jgi:hypothetical protein
LLGTALVLILVFYGAGGYVFADMIRTDALLPQPPTPDYGVWVRAVDEETITLGSDKEREDTTRPGLAGLAWEDGYGQIGDILSVDGLDVTRSFSIRFGAPPPVCVGDPADCDPVDIEGWTYPGDPSSLDMEYREVTYQSPLGAMGAWLVDGGDGSVWAIHAHGWRSSRREALRSLPIYHQAGITSLVIDLRNDPDAPADPSGLYRFGRSEWEDVEAAVDFAVANGAEAVILVGYSTGAAVHLAYLENSEGTSPSVGLVLDSPNADMGATVRHGAAGRTLPGTPIPVPSSLAIAAMLIADVRWDVDWDSINYVNRASEIVDIPTIVFHGVEDDRVPIEVSRRLRAQAPDLIELVEVEGAGHVTSWNVDPEGYEETLTRFLAALSG